MLFGKQVGHLAQGMPYIVSREEATNTLVCIKESKVPRDRRKDFTYKNIVCNYLDHKIEKHRTHITVGENRINHPFDFSASPL